MNRIADIGSYHKGNTAQSWRYCLKTVETKKRGRTKETIEEAVRDHLRQCDALPFAKDGTLEAKPDRIFRSVIV